MNSTAFAILIRQTVVGTLYLAPFWLAFLYIPTPFNILAACLLAIKTKLPKDTDLYEVQVLAKQAALILTRTGTDEDRVNLGRMKQAFTFDDQILHDADVDGASTKFLVDTAFLMAEGLSIAIMVVWFLLA